MVYDGAGLVNIVEEGWPGEEAAWEDLPCEDTYEHELNSVLEGLDSHSLAVAGCSRSGSFHSGGSPTPYDWVRRRSRHGSDGSRPGSDCWSPSCRNSLSTTTSQSDSRVRRPSYSCSPFQHRRHYAVRRKAGPNLRGFSKL